MTAPTSAAKFTNQLMNNSAPVVEGNVEMPDGSRPGFVGYITHTWRYVFAQFATTTVAISPTWSQAVSNPPTQAEVQAIVTQVQLLSKQLGR